MVKVMNFEVFTLDKLCITHAGTDLEFQVRGGAHLKKLRRAEGGAKIFGVFRVKNHDFTPKNHIFSNFRGGGGRWCARPPGSAPDMHILNKHEDIEFSAHDAFLQ